MITVDDGHRSVFTDMLPVVREYGVPVNYLHLSVGYLEREVPR